MINEKWLNLASGQNKLEHRDPVTQVVDGYFFGIDYKKNENVDAVIDLEDFPWPIESDSAEFIHCSHYVEHTPMETLAKRLLKMIDEAYDFKHLKEKVSIIDLNAPSDGLILFMDEVYRILKPEGKIKIIAPYYTSVRAVQDPTHRRYIAEATFFYFNKEWRNVNKLDHYQGACDFDFEYGYDTQNTWATREDSARNFATTHYHNVVNDIHVTLTKKVR